MPSTPAGRAAAEPEAAVYAIADTHLGLRERGPEADTDDPVVLAQFLRWLAAVPDGGRALPAWDGRGIVERTLRPPTQLLLLGDIVELWDAEDDAVLTSAGSVAPALAAVRAEKVWVLGNHDDALANIEGGLPLGEPGLRIVVGTYPALEAGKPWEPLRIGDRAYLFLHGHQADRHFMGTAGGWRLLGPIRQFGGATGAYAWLFLPLGLLALVAGAATPLALVVGAALIAVALPRAYMTVARPFWNKLSGRRYDRPGMLQGFRAWWKGVHAQVGDAEDLGVVFGHTHFLDWFEVPARGPAGATPEERALAADLQALKRRRHTLFSVSSWIRTKGAHKDLTRATVFYADPDGPLFLGWDWTDQQPFHIPFHFVRKLRLGGRLDEGDLAIAERLGWPATLTRQWDEGGEKLRARRRRGPPRGPAAEPAPKPSPAAREPEVAGARLADPGLRDGRGG